MRHALPFKEVVGTFVCVKKRRHVPEEELVPEAGLREKRSALPGRQHQGSIENVSHTPPLFGTQ
jgi:hypothetical protein